MRISMLISLIRPIGPVVIGISLGFTLSLLSVTWVEEPCSNPDWNQGDGVALQLGGNPYSLPAGNLENGEKMEDFEPRIVPYKPVQQQPPPKKMYRAKYISTELGIRERLFAGVLTSKNTMNTMAVAVNRTIRHHLDNVVYFTGMRNRKIPHGMFVVTHGDERLIWNMFQTIRYVLEHYINEYDWFYFVQDDTYSQADRIKSLVGHLSIHTDLYMGSPEEFIGDEMEGRYCYGGFGYLLSRTLLLKLQPYLESCRNDILSARPDEWLGRCIVDYGNVNCVDEQEQDNGASTQNPGEDKTLQSFLSWCKEVRLELSEKVYVSREGTVADYGMLAREEIEEGEVIFSIPRAALLNQSRTAIHSILEKEEESLKSQSGWVPLLLALMFEYTNSKSHWSPYLSLWTDFRALDHPMFWPKEERERLLQGTGVSEAVENDLANILKEYNDIILPFIQSHREVLDPQKHTLELYQSLVAFVMAYSFQEPLEEDEEEEKEPNPPMMVPMADILNHVANHNANLEFRTDSLKMVSVKRIKKGEEVFNTYGELANWQLLHMYGFVESYPSNTNDSADIQMTTMYKAALQAARTESERSLVVEKWDLLCQLDIVGEEGAFVFGQSGSLTDEELYTSLKVLCMPVEQFKEFKENEGWEEAEEEDDEDEMAAALSNEGIPKLSLPWRRLLGDSVTLTLQDYADELQPDKELLGDWQAYGRLSSRERLALQLRYGQKVTLHQLLELTQCHSV